MLLDQYDFYDIYAVLTRIRMKPDHFCNPAIVKSVYEILTAPQKDDTSESHIIAKALRNIQGIDEKLFRWIYTDNVYPDRKIIQNDGCYSFLAKGFLKMIAFAEQGAIMQLQDLADALHNVPLFFADGCKNFRAETKVQFAYYDKKYKTNLLEELANAAMSFN